LGQTVITSTATSPAGNTSEFSQCLGGLLAATSTALASNLNPSTVGQSVTFTATITGASPTGTVQFKDGATNLGAVVAVSGAATAQLTTSALTQGTHAITAVYSGDANNATSTSPVVDQVVNAGAAGATTTALSSSVNPSLVGQSVTFTATVAGASPTGTVEFFDGATSLGSGALAGGAATLSTSSLTLGTHLITAVYGGDAGNGGSTSPIVSQSVTALVPPPSPPGTTAIPTLSQLALVLLIVALGLLGWRHRREG
jgi:hypothetical protein